MTFTTPVNTSVALPCHALPALPPVNTSVAPPCPALPCRQVDAKLAEDERKLELERLPTQEQCMQLSTALLVPLLLQPECPDSA